MAKKKEIEKVKCPGCHAYFVEQGDLCANCQNREIKEDEDLDTNDEDEE